MLPPPLADKLSQDVPVSVTSPRRPHSTRVTRSTRQAFLDSLAVEPKVPPKDEESSVQSATIAVIDARAGAEASHDQQILAEGEVNAETNDEEHPTDDSRVALDPVDDGATTDAEYSEDGDHAAEDSLPDVSTGADLDPNPDVDEDDELETDVAETLFDLVDMVEAAAAEEERQKALPSPGTVSPRPRSSMVRTDISLADLLKRMPSSLFLVFVCILMTPRAERPSTYCTSSLCTAGIARGSRSASRCTRTR